MAANLNGVIVWQGISPIDHVTHLTAVLTAIKRPSQNIKTGPMLQLWVVPTHLDPVEASLNGQDLAYCGHCIHRYDPATGVRTCYLELGKAVLAICKCLQRGGYARISAAQLRQLVSGKSVRIGAYAEATLLPLYLIKVLASGRNYTAYTHRWRELSYHWRRYFMASTDTPAEAIEARAKGWRTYTTSMEPGPGEIQCPASHESGNLTTCAKCGLCSGTNSKARVSITIPPHGAHKRHYVHFLELAA